jgi:hypothetical protein
MSAEIQKLGFVVDVAAFTDFTITGNGVFVVESG